MSLQHGCRRSDKTITVLRNSECNQAVLVTATILLAKINKYDFNNNCHSHNSLATRFQLQYWRRPNTHTPRIGPNCTHYQTALIVFLGTAALSSL